MRDWYYTKMGIQQGPVPEDQLRRMIRRGEVGGMTLVWSEGMPDWLPLERVTELWDGGRAEAAREGTAVPEPPDLVGSPIESGALRQRDARSGGGEPGRKIPNYLWQSIVTLVISCLLTFGACMPLGLPFEIVAVVYASKVDGLLTRRDFMGADSSSRNAKLWMIMSFAMNGLMILGVIGLVVWIFTKG